MRRFWRWLLEPLMSTPTEAKPLTVSEIDEVLTHWANKLHIDPDPLNRWASLTTIDRWLDARLRLEQIKDQHGGEER